MVISANNKHVYTDMVTLVYSVLSASDGRVSTVAMTGNGGLVYTSDAAAEEKTTKSRGGSRRANYPILTQGDSDKK